ncbi:MAG: AMP-binding protein [Acidimicrobiales bacterium]
MKVPLTINDFLDRGAAVYPDRVAIVDEPNQVASPLNDITFAELADIRRQMGVAMDKLGLGFGARVAMVSHNSARLLTSFFGVSGNGRVFVPINFRLSRAEVEYIVTHCGAEALLIDPELADSLGDIPCKNVWIIGEASDAVWLAMRVNLSRGHSDGTQRRPSTTPRAPRPGRRGSSKLIGPGGLTQSRLAGMPE